MKWVYALVSAWLLSSCASLDVGERNARAEQIARQYAFSKFEIQTPNFDLVGFSRSQQQQRVLHVYIEGDGFAWVTRHQPSNNPTPMNPVALKLAVLDDHSAAYLARPCQYVALTKPCSSRYWTSARFSAEVVGAMDEALTQLKQNTGAQQLVLIGYSGGGAIAALLAARRADVIHLVTVAGNLDPLAWTRWHAVPELHESLNPKAYASALARVRQTHFVGEQDSIVPIQIYRSYRDAFPAEANIALKLVPHVDHGCCWESAWSSLLKTLQ